jgi:hypothetical protein
MRICSTGAAALMLLACFAAPPARGQAIDPATWAPKDALVFVGIPDVTQLVENYKKTSGYKIFEDPALRDLNEMEIWGKMLDKFRSSLSKGVGVEPSELKNPFGGPLAFSLLAPARKDAPPDFTLVATIKETALMRQYYDKLVVNLKKAAEQHEAVSFAGGTIDAFRGRSGKPADDATSDKPEVSSEDIDEVLDEDPGTEAIEKFIEEMFSPEKLPESFAMLLSEDRLIVARDAEMVKGVARRERSESSLKDAEDYKAFPRQFEKPGHVRFLINVPKFFELLKAENEDSAKEVSAIFGISCWRSVIGQVRIAEDKLESHLEAVALMSGERTGMAKILSMKNREIPPPRTISSEAMIFCTINVNPPELLDEIERITRQLDPDTADEMRQQMDSVEVAEGEKISIRKDIVENLAGPLVFSLGFASPVTPDSMRIQLAIGQRSTKSIRRVMDLIVASAGAVSRELKGSTIWDWPMFALSLALTDDALVAGNTAAVESAVQGSGGMAENAALRRLLPHAQKEAWGVVFFDMGRFYEAMIDLAKRDDNGTNFVIASMIEGFRSSLPKDKLDEARKMQKYQVPSLMTISTTSDGIRIDAVAVAPE